MVNWMALASMVVEPAPVDGKFRPMSSEWPREGLVDGKFRRISCEWPGEGYGFYHIYPDLKVEMLACSTTDVVLQGLRGVIYNASRFVTPTPTRSFANVPSVSPMSSI
jgi:hypothetical protein